MNFTQQNVRFSNLLSSTLCLSALVNLLQITTSVRFILRDSVSAGRLDLPPAPSIGERTPPEPPPVLPACGAATFAFAI